MALRASDVAAASRLLSKVTWIRGVGVAAATGVVGLIGGGGNGAASRIVLSAVMAASNSRDDCESSECCDGDCVSAGSIVASLSATSAAD